jgi:glutamine---fructose-6-phosphate transaminase (isomerizing)
VFTDELREQPFALRNLISTYRSEAGTAALDRLAALRENGRARGVPPGPVILTGMGSSLYAADAVVPRLISGGVDASVREAGEWLHYGMRATPEAGLVFAISQSGESVETRTLAERLADGVPVAAITNDPESRMAQAAQVVLPLHAGREEMISAKTYTNSLGVLHLAAAALLGEDRSATVDALAAAAAAMEQALEPGLEPLIGEAAQWLDEARCIHALARGPSLAAAREGALVLGEGAHLAVTALPAGSFRHGPMELAGPGHVALIFAPNSPTRALMDRLRGDLLRADSRVICLADDRTADHSPNQITFPLTGSPGESYFPLSAAMIVERLLAAVAERRGIIPGHFQFGGKITAAE